MSEPGEDQRSARTIFIVIAVILGVQIIAGLGIYASFDNWPARGTFGDMFGAVNALFSGLALAGVVYAILLQRRELALQRQELELTRHELERSAEAQEASATILREQLRLQEEQKERDQERAFREAAPALVFQGGSYTGNHATFEMVNHGAPIYDLEAHRTTGPLRPEIERTDSLVPGEKRKLVVHFEQGQADGYFGISFCDTLGNRRPLTLFYNKRDSTVREMPRLPEDIDLGRENGEAD